MVFFLSILGWSFLESLSRSVGPDRCTTCNLHLKGGPVGVRWLSLRCLIKLASFLWKGKNSTVDGVVTAYLSLVERFCIYRG